MKKDRVYLVWQSFLSKKKYKVAELYKENDKYYFRYLLEKVEDAKKDGFRPLIQFPDINAIYENENLFPSFGARLPESSRPEIKKILEEYGMTKYDEFELLKRSGAKLPTDYYEFIEDDE